MEKLSELEDPRQPSNGTRHDFREILVIAVCAMLSDADSFEDIALWGRLKADWLRRFLVLKNGIPSQDTFLRVFRVLDPKQFEAVFRRWVGGIVGALDGVMAVDGKTLRRSADGDAPPVHMVSAFSTELGLVLKSHGRTVMQLSWVAASGKEIDPELWPGCKTVGCVVSQRVVGDKVAELEERYYISSRKLTAEELAKTVRAHWAIENRLHWMLDVCFGEDDCMIRKDNAPQNLSLLKKIVLNLIRADKTDTAKTSLRLKRKRAAWDDDIRMKMLGIHPL